MRDQTETTGTLNLRRSQTQWRHNTFERGTKAVQWHNRYDSDNMGTLEFRAGYSHATFYNQPLQITYRYNAINQDLHYDTQSDTHFTLPNPEALVDPANYVLNGGYLETSKVFQDVAEARLDYHYNVGLGDRGFGFQAGAAFRHYYLERDREHHRYLTDGSTLEGMAHVMNPPLMGMPYPLLWVDQQKFKDNIQPNLANNEPVSYADSLTSDYSYAEDVTNAYAAVTYATDRLRLIAGLRYDHVSTDARAPQTVNGELLPEMTSYRGGYEKLLPSVNGLYRITPNFRVKFGYSRTLGRPNPSHIAQASNVDSEEMTISRGNPDLRPRISDNYEISVEYFFSGSDGMLTFSLFNKDISDDILRIRTTGEIDGEIYSITETINGDSGRYRGFEVGFVDSKLDFLPGALKNLGVSANLLHVDGRSTYTQDGVQKTRHTLLDQMRWAANGNIFYNFGKGEVRLAYNYQSKYIDTLGNETWLDIGYGANDTFDLTARYDINKNWRVQFQARNLFNRNRTRLVGQDLGYTRANIEYGNTYFLRLTYRM